MFYLNWHMLCLLVSFSLPLFLNSKVTLPDIETSFLWQVSHCWDFSGPGVPGVLLASRHPAQSLFYL